MKATQTLAALLLPALVYAQGFLDPTFGTNGYVTFDYMGSFEEFRDIAVQPDGRIIAAGHASGGPIGGQPLIVRYMEDGTLDPDFNGTGWALGPGPTWQDPGTFRAVALQPDGKILCLGPAKPIPNDPLSVLVVRYLPDGTLDPSFGTGGYVTHRAATDLNRTAQDIALTADGRIRICGWATVEGDNDHDYMFLGLLQDGSLDPTFGNGGWQIFHAGSSTQHSRAYSLAIQSDGSIVAATEGRLPGPDYITIWGLRLQPDGTLDTGFGEGGYLYNYNEAEMPWDVAVGPNDEVFFAGFGPMPGPYQDLVTMLVDADGQNPVENTYEASPDAVLMPHAGRIMPDGKTLAFACSGDRAYLLRRSPDGTLDPSFGNAGIVTDPDLAFDAPLTSSETGGLVLDGYGRILVCGRSGMVPGDGEDAIIAAFLPTVVGVGENAHARGLQLVPNPCHDRLTMHYADAGQPWSIMDATGRLVRSGSTSSDHMVIDVQDLAPGTYIMHLQADQGVRTSTFVKR